MEGPLERPVGPVLLAVHGLQPLVATVDSGCLRLTIQEDEKLQRWKGMARR